MILFQRKSRWQTSHCSGVHEAQPRAPPSPKVCSSPRGSAARFPDPLASGAWLEYRGSAENKKLQETRGFTQGLQCANKDRHAHGTDIGSVSLLASSLTGCLRTPVSERARAGLGAAWKEEAYLSGDKKGPSYTRWPGVLWWLLVHTYGVA